jgi:hypothetical protein
MFRMLRERDDRSSIAAESGRRGSWRGSASYTRKGVVGRLDTRGRAERIRREGSRRWFLLSRKRNSGSHPCSSEGRGLGEGGVCSERVIRGVAERPGPSRGTQGRGSRRGGEGIVGRGSEGPHWRSTVGRWGCPVGEGGGRE